MAVRGNKSADLHTDGHLRNAFGGNSPPPAYLSFLYFIRLGAALLPLRATKSS